MRSGRLILPRSFLQSVTTKVMNSSPITRCQSYWREHVLAAAAHDGTIVEYAAKHGLKTQDIYQWKTTLTKKGLLPLAPKPPWVDFIPSQTVAVGELSNENSVSCRITFASGVVLELYSPIPVSELCKLLDKLNEQ